MEVRVFKLKNAMFNDTYLNGYLFNDGIYTTTDPVIANKLLATNAVDEIINIEQEKPKIIKVGGSQNNTKPKPKK